MFILLYPFLIVFLILKQPIQKDKKKIKQILFGKIITTPKDIWIHGVSGGEVILIKELLKSAPQSLSFHLTTSSLTGYQLLEKEYSRSKHISYSYHPLDLFFIIQPWFNKIKAKKLIVIEHDQWPFILFYLKKKNIPSYLVNIDFKPRDLKRYQQFSFLLKYLFNFDFFSYQNQEARQIGASLKLDKIAPSLFEQNLKLLMTARFMKNTHLSLTQQTHRKRKWITLGSSHAPEEELLVPQLLSNEQDLADRQLFVIPRHPNRSTELMHLFSKKYKCAYLNNLSDIRFEADIYLVNKMGLSLNIYQLSDLVLIGDSFRPTQGGHNFLEPLYFGKPCIYGQYLRTFSDLSVSFEKEKITYRCEVKNLAPLVKQLLTSKNSKRERKRVKAYQIIKQHLPSQKKISDLFELSVN